MADVMGFTALDLFLWHHKCMQIPALYSVNYRNNEKFGFKQKKNLNTEEEWNI